MPYDMSKPKFFKKYRRLSQTKHFGFSTVNKKIETNLWYQSQFIMNPINSFNASYFYNSLMSERGSMSDNNK